LPHVLREIADRSHSESLIVQLLIGNKFWYAKGGVETYLFELLEELPAWDWTFVPFAMRHATNRPNEYEQFFVDEVDYHAEHSFGGKVRAAGRLLYSRHAARQLTALLDTVHIDLAHLHNIYHQLSPAILPILAERRIPVVMTLHDLKLACPNYKMRTGDGICERCIGGNYYNAVVHRCVQNSLAASALCAFELYAHRKSGLYVDNVDRFIVPSRFYLQKIAQAGIPADKLTWLPSFTHVERYHPVYGGEDYCVYVGRLSEEKGLITLVNAVRGFKGTLVIVGDGPVRPVLEQMVERDNLTNVRVIGSRSGQALIDILRHARFSIIPSEWYENCPRSCIESFASGTPVIGARIGGIPEMVDDGETGLLFTPFSKEDLRAKIDYLFARNDEAARMGRNARAKAEQEYGAASHMRRLMAVYHDVLASRGVAAPQLKPQMVAG
jgi:glycosyltransferase involved in cell wall biosynthesis